MAVSRHGVVAAVNEKEVVLWTIGGRRRTLDIGGRVPSNEPGSSPMRFSKDGKHLAIGCRDGYVCVVDVDRARLLEKFAAHDGEVCSVAFAPQTPVVIASSGGSGGEVKLWDVASRKLTRRFDREGHRANVVSIAFSREGNLLVTGSFDNTIKVWSVENDGGPVKTLIGHVGPVKELLFSSSGRTLFSCGGDRTVRIWDFDTFQSKLVLDTEHSTPTFALSKDETVLVSANYEGTMRFWRAPRSLP